MQFETEFATFRAALHVLIRHWWLPVSGSSHRQLLTHDQDVQNQVETSHIQLQTPLLSKFILLAYFMFQAAFGVIFPT